MAALAAMRATPRRRAEIIPVPLKANAKPYQGGMVQIDATGFGVAAGAVVANRTVGVCRSNILDSDNTGGADGAKTIEVERGVFQFANSAAGDLIALTEYGQPCYVVDDQTVAKTNNAGARPQAGIVRGVDAGGVWVEF